MVASPDLPESKPIWSRDEHFQVYEQCDEVQLIEAISVPDLWSAQDANRPYFSVSPRGNPFFVLAH